MGEKAEPTPGPWHAFIRRDTNTFAVFGPENDPRKPVVEWTGFDATITELGAKTVEDNVHMIAASRDMYEALVSLREVVRSSLLPAMNEAAKHLPEGHAARQWSVADDFAFQLAAGKADNAIAKADGESND